MINTVKIQGEGFLVNGNMSVPQAEGNRHYQEVLEWIAEGNTPEPEFTKAELKQQVIDEANQLAKATKQEALTSLTVVTSLGNEFDGNETARNNMLSAIQASTFTGTTATNWRMADNAVVEVTLDELKEALTLSIQAVGVIVTEIA